MKPFLKQKIKKKLREKENEMELHIDKVGVRDEEDCICANCGTYFRASRQMYYLNNDDFICSKKCFKEYAESYFHLTKVSEIK